MHKSKRWPCHSQDRLMLQLLLLLLPMRSGDALPDAVVVVVVLLVHILPSIVIVAVVDVVFVKSIV